MGLYRRARDAVKKSTSNVHPQRWVLTLRPSCIERVPQGVKQVVLEWKGSGSKLSFTKVQPVNSAGMVVFDETLNMTTTLYRTETGFEAKPYTMRAMEVQEVKSMGRSFDKTSCIAEYKNLDFSVFTRTCLEHAGAEEEIEVSLKGSKGALVLRAFVKASLLNDLENYEGEHVSSELSFISEERTPASALDEEYIDDDDSQELPCLGGPGQGSSMSTTSDESEAMHTHMPSPGRKHTQTARDDKPAFSKAAAASKSSAKAQSALPSAVSLDTGVSRSHRTRERDRNREKHHDRTKSVDWCLETITEADQRWSVPGPDGAPDADEDAAPTSRRRAKEPQQALTGLPQSFSFLNNLFRNKPPSSLKDLSPDELRIEAARRETVEIKGEQDLDTLREHAVNLVYARELLKAKNNELKQMLTDSQTHVHSDETITQDLVQAKLDLADAAYEKLQLQSAYDRVANKNRTLSRKLTQASVDRDLLAHRLSRANGMDH